MSDLKYNYTDAGFCRVYYTWLDSEKKKIHYCAQEEFKGVIKFYRCSGGTYNEPEYEVFPKFAPPLSPGNTVLDKIVNDYIKQKWS